VVYKAVIFDLDGTLLDALQDIADSYNAALGTLGFPVHDMQAYRYFVGEGAFVTALKVLPELFRNPDIVGQLLTGMGKEYSKRWAVHTRPYPGIPELLNQLVAKDIKMAILSNKQHEFIIEQVEKLLSHWNFGAVIGASGAMPCKPDPTGALEISEKLSVSPTDFLYLGDTAIDMQAATAAGMYPVGVLWGFRTDSELMAGGARTLIKYPTDLLALL
jgi:phosphoglycolate phosphatase